LKERVERWLRSAGRLLLLLGAFAALHTLSMQVVLGNIAIPSLPVVLPIAIAGAWKWPRATRWAVLCAIPPFLFNMEVMEFSGPGIDLGYPGGLWAIATLLLWTRYVADSEFRRRLLSTSRIACRNWPCWRSYVNLGARFVVADISDAKSVLQELRAIVPDLPSVPVQPIILAMQEEPGMFDFYRNFRSFLNVHRYASQEQLIADLGEKVIRPAELKVLDLQRSA
jgi:hypothetical protein